uniref:Uncharacterized protein n=1 Tax=Caenorhabditis japonica TaxID=281687 RepID=A0A8R1IQA8_CAEJA
MRLLDAYNNLTPLSSDPTAVSGGSSVVEQV